MPVGSIVCTMAPNLASMLRLMLLNQCGLDPRWMYQNDCPNLSDGDVFDFIVIGGGSAGSAVAGRLSENKNWRVLLVEAGGYPTSLIEIPAFISELYGHEQFDWNYKTEPSNSSCMGFKEGRCVWPRGKVLGGCSSTNGMLHVQGLKSDYDHWEKLGNIGWSYNDVLPYFKKMLDGPLKVSYIRASTIVREALLRAAGEAGYPISNQREDVSGFFESLAAIGEGTRWSSAKAFLTKLKHRTNLKVSVNTLATQILFSKKKAVGVEVLINGKKVRVYAKNEVVVSGGSINSPQLLMLSGVGPEEHLSKLGIKTIADLPVGKNLHDHFMMRGLFVLLDVPVNSSLDFCTVANMYCAKRDGPLASVGTANIMWFFNTINQYLPPNVQIHNFYYNRNSEGVLRQQFDPQGFPQDVLDQLIEANKRYGLMNFASTASKPKSRGEILLRSTNPLDPPLIYPNYLTHQDDLEAMLGSVQHIKRLIAQPALQALGARFLGLKPANCASLNFDSREFWECNFRNLGSTVYHPVGTCKMGTDRDPGSVVDQRLKVYGVENLRVIDCSIMPRIINRNTNAACIMIGEKGADLIKAEWGLKSSTTGCH